jgi:hypothetical protein
VPLLWLLREVLFWLHGWQGAGRCGWHYMHPLLLLAGMPRLMHIANKWRLLRT